MGASSITEVTVSTSGRLIWRTGSFPKEVPALAVFLFFLPVGVTAQVLHSVLVGGFRVYFT